MGSLEKGSLEKGSLEMGSLEGDSLEGCLSPRMSEIMKEGLCAGCDKLAEDTEEGGALSSASLESPVRLSRCEICPIPCRNLWHSGRECCSLGVDEPRERFSGSIAEVGGKY